MRDKVKKIECKNNIQGSAYQPKVLEQANLTIPLLCQSAQMVYAGNSRQLHPLEEKY